MEYQQVDQIPVQYTSNFQRAYPPSVAFYDALTINQAPLNEVLPSTSASNLPTVVQNLLPQDGTSLNPTTAVSMGPSVLMNLEAIQPQTTVAAEVAVKTTITVNPTTAVSTVISIAQPYISPWRRPHSKSHLTHDHNLNAGVHRQDGAVRATTVASVATIGNSFPPPTAYLAANAQIGNQSNQVVGAQQNLSHRYSTDWKTQFVQEVSADEEDLRRIQATNNATRADQAIGTVDPSTSTPIPNLTAQQQANFNLYVRPFAPTSVTTAP